MAGGRPTDYTPELADEICGKLAGGEPLSKICKEEEYPSAVTVFSWLRKHEEFLNNYTRAREEQANYYADDIVAIVDETDDPAKARLQMEARKWVSSKLLPKKYGDSTQLKHADADGNKLEGLDVSFVPSKNTDT